MMLFEPKVQYDSKGRTPNIDGKIFKNITYKQQISPESILYYIYGVLYSPIYREKYMEGAASELVIVLIPDMHAFGDLDGDGVEDAAVVLATSGGGSGTFISLEAVINDNGTPNHAATVLLGDRVQVKSVAVESGEITVDMVTHGPDDPLYRPTLEVTHKYKLQGDTLVHISSRD